MDLRNLKNLSSPKYKTSLISLFVIGGAAVYFSLSMFGGSSKENKSSVGEASVTLTSYNDADLKGPRSEDYAKNENTEIAKVYQERRVREKQAAIEGDKSFTFTIADYAIESVEEDKDAKPDVLKGILEKSLEPAPEVDTIDDESGEEEVMDIVDEAPRASYQDQLNVTKTKRDHETNKHSGATKYAQTTQTELTDFMAQVSSAAAFTHSIDGRNQRDEVGATIVKSYSTQARKDDTDNEASVKELSHKEVTSADYARYIGVMPAVKSERVIRINAGDIAYTRLQIGINTDEISPVRAEILSGELAGAVLLGSPRRAGKKAIVELDTMTFEGEQYSIDAVALDLDTKRTAMADDVDSHYGENLVYLTIASILTGYSNSLQSWEEESNSGSDATIQTKNKVDDLDDRLMVGLGDAGQEMKSIFKDQINRQPTVYKYPDDIGVMFMSQLNIGPKSN